MLSSSFSLSILLSYYLSFLLSPSRTALTSFLLIVQADWRCRNTNVHYTTYDIWYTYIWFIWATCKNKEQQLANPQTQILLLVLACLLCFPFPSLQLPLFSSSFFEFLYFLRVHKIKMHALLLDKSNYLVCVGGEEGWRGSIVHLRCV